MSQKLINQAVKKLNGLGILCVQDLKDAANRFNVTPMAFLQDVVGDAAPYITKQIA